METILLGLAGPVLGLLGVGIGVWYGQKRWRRDRGDHRTSFYVAKQREAYIGLWELIQQAHIAMRLSLNGPARPGSILSKLFISVMTELNSFGLRYGIYISEEDRFLAQDYLSLVYDFILIADETPDPPRAAVGATYILPESTRLDYPVVKEAEDKVNVVGDRLMARIREVLGAPKGDLSQVVGPERMAKMPRLPLPVDIVLPKLSKAAERSDDADVPNQADEKAADASDLMPE